MFNIQGSEMIFLLLVALIILGPEKLPDAIRKFGRAYSEFKKMANGFPGELREALDEPMRELRDTADMMRSAVDFNDDAAPTATDPTPPPPIKREQGLNFGSANPRRTAATPSEPVPAEPAAREPGLNFGSANPARPAPARDPLAAVAAAAITEPEPEPAEDAPSSAGPVDAGEPDTAPVETDR